MPVTTRTSGKTPASAPASRVYRSSRPPQQIRFPARQKSIKTYGRKSTSRALAQQTMTQFYEPLELEPDDEDMADNRRQKRRRTMGDSPAPTSSFHTQTLTQFVAKRATPQEEDGLMIRDSQDEDELEIVAETRSNSIVPQTPAKQQTRVVIEIPSSQPTPFTPMLERYPLDAPSPLKAASTNADAPSPSLATLSKQPRNLVIQDSYGSASPSSKSDKLQTPLGRTPLAPLQLSRENTRRTLDFSAKTPKRVERLCEIPDSDDELASAGPTPVLRRLIDVGNTSQVGKAQTPTPRRPLEQVPDSPIMLPETPTRHSPRREIHDTGPRSAQIQDNTETSSDSLTSPPPSEPAPERVPDTPIRLPQLENSAEIPSDNPTPAPSRALPQAVVTSSPAAEETPISSPPMKTPQLPKETVAPRSQYKSQYRSQHYSSQLLESQRVPLEIIRAMGPATDRTDIIISMDPSDVEKIAEGITTHEFRSYRISATVARFWIYETKPRHELRYMATVSTAKEPGGIDSSDTGLGNSAFNEGKGAKFAYELEQVYELNNPVSLEVMRRNGWVEDAPEKYAYIPPAVVGQLLGNLRRALFEDSRGGDDETEVPDLSISQELATQIRSELEHADRTSSDEIIPASQDEVPLELPHDAISDESCEIIPQSSFAAPLAPPPPRRFGLRGQTASVRGRNAPVPFSQATTASQPSSPEKSVLQSVPRPQLHSSEPSLPGYLGDSSPLEVRSNFRRTAARPQELELGSSSSQVHLPESLFEEVRRAPVVLDSDGDEDDEL